MRSDMAKVIVERPRPGSCHQKARKGYHKLIQRCDWEDQPQRESRRHRVGRRRPFNEHLGPLRKFLQSRVGRPWSQVYAEICENLSRDSVVQDHVRDHVDDFVATQVVLIEGVPCHATGRGYGTPLWPWRWRHCFCVCPASGTLKRVPRPRLAPPEQPCRAVPINAREACLLQDGVWWLVRVKPFPPPSPLAPASVHDAVLGRHLSREDAIAVYGTPVCGVGRERRLGKREMKQLPIPIDLQRLNRRGRVVQGPSAPNAVTPAGRTRRGR
jgi:hypothetical protein